MPSYLTTRAGSLASAQSFESEHWYYHFPQCSSMSCHEVRSNMPVIPNSPNLTGVPYLDSVAPSLHNPQAVIRHASKLYPLWAISVNKVSARALNMVISKCLCNRGANVGVLSSWSLKQCDIDGLFASGLSRRFKNCCFSVNENLYQQPESVDKSISVLQALLS